MTAQKEEKSIRVKLTKREVEKHPPRSTAFLIHDTEIKGFRCKVTPKGKRTYHLYYRTASGQQRNPAIGTHGNITCDQAREIAKQWMGEVSRGGDPSKSKQELRQSDTIAELWQRYQKAKKPHLKASSMTELTRLWEKYLLPEFGRVKASQLESAAIRRFHEKNAHRPYTANRMLEAIRSLYNHAIENEWLQITRNPCTSVKKNKERKRERFLSMEEIGRLSEVLRETEHKKTESKSVINVIRLLLFTGCRLGEILSLKWEYIDYEQSCLRLPDSKTGAKSVYISAPALEVLGGIERIEGNPHVITGGMKSGQLAPPQKAWQRIRKLAGLEDVRLHDLRHSFASIGAASGMSLPMIGALLGHSQSQTTARYTHLIGDPMKQAANVIGEKIVAAMEGKQAEVIPMKKYHE